MPAAPAARRLCLRDQHKPLPCPGVGPAAQGGVGAGQTVHDLDLQGFHRGLIQLSGHGGSIQNIDTLRQRIAAVRDGLDRDTVPAQGSHGLPYGGAAHAELSGQLLPGDIPPARSIQRRQHLLLDHFCRPLINPTVGQYTATPVGMSTSFPRHG